MQSSGLLPVRDSQGGEMHQMTSAGIVRCSRATSRSMFAQKMKSGDADDGVVFWLSLIHISEPTRPP